MKAASRSAPGRPAWLGAALVAPALLVGLLVIAYPIARTVDLSLRRASMETLGRRAPFAGAANFARALGNRRFLSSLGITVVFAATGSVGSVGLGLATALALAGRVRGRAALRTVCIFPYAAPIAATAFAWQWLLHYDYGAVNTMLRSAGLPGVAWLTTPGLDLGVCVAFQAWRYFPFAMILILARLRSIPPELYEAASVDGAGRWAGFRHITWPQVAPLCGLLVTLRALWTFNRFDDVFLLTGGRAGTHVATIELYEAAFQGRQDFGLAAAMAILILAVFVIPALCARKVKQWAAPR